MHEKVLITGASGLLGSELSKMFKGLYRTLGVNSSNFDITDCDSAREFIKRMNPDIILHTAAMVDVDKCQQEPETAEKVNATGTENIARICRELNSRMIYYSTDYVFDGTKDSPYNEDDTPNPINVYGKTKLEGEKRAKEILDNVCIMRISWLYGAAKENFVTKTLKEARQRYRDGLEGQDIEPLRIASDQISSPTWAYDIAEQTQKIIDNNLSGIIHAVSEGQCSRFKLAEYIFEEISWDLPMEPVDISSYNLAAERPLNTALENKRLNDNNLSVMQDYRDAIREFLGVYHGDE